MAHDEGTKAFAQSSSFAEILLTLFFDLPGVVSTHAHCGNRRGSQIKGAWFKWSLLL